MVTPGGEFTSLLFPFLVQQERGVTVREVPLEALADSVGPRTTLVAWSAVQSSDGRLADNDAVVEAAAAVGALTVVDATQATGWLRVPHDRVDADGLLGLQVAVLPSRHGLHGGVASGVG